MSTLKDRAYMLQLGLMSLSCYMKALGGGRAKVPSDSGGMGLIPLYATQHQTSGKSCPSDVATPHPFNAQPI